ncbi:hypothetical protein HYFRA_00008963 [Hymenoscyphus fraxineus]|uniref:Uncharacterized protein n=1 Tax=Hymenoscyphus fraxineus TaxID=746836 RepID=A0A9N9KSK3_9HELO|nr:hypothetical protein HYFRA_00008963 [Hymenoscyphus fraxineus]
MYSNTVLIALLAAVVEARFGQEQGNGAITAIGALGDLGSSGQAATLAGGSIQFLLAAANPCAKLTQADNIITTLGNSERAVAAARGLVAAEQNFNPFVVSIPNICNDPTLPKSVELRGVLPLIDPLVGGQDVANALSAKSITTPFEATGLSVAQVLVAQGFSNFTAVAADGTKVDASTLGSGAAAPAAPVVDAPAGDNSTAPVATPAADPVATPAPNVDACGQTIIPAPTTMVTMTKPAATAAPAANNSSDANGGADAGVAGKGAVKDAVAGNFDGFVKSTIAGLDFGLCVPTMKFEAGLNGRKETENTFQAIDPLVNKGQQEALNFNIITNRIKDQMVNVCGANQAAKDAVAAAKEKISTLGKEASTADAWNTELGFAGTNINPDNAPQPGLVGHAA